MVKESMVGLVGRLEGGKLRQACVSLDPSPLYLSLLCLFLSLCLSLSLVYVTHCPGVGAGSKPLAWGLEMGPSWGRIDIWS